MQGRDKYEVILGGSGAIIGVIVAEGAMLYGFLKVSQALRDILPMNSMRVFNGVGASMLILAAPLIAYPGILMGVGVGAVVGSSVDFLAKYATDKITRDKIKFFCEKSSNSDNHSYNDVDTVSEIINQYAGVSRNLSSR
jgi:hypothetical protein